jgi:hypothetical protein
MTDPRRTGPADPAAALEGLLGLARAQLPGVGGSGEAVQDPSYREVRRRLARDQRGRRGGRRRWPWLLVATTAVGVAALAVGLEHRAAQGPRLSYVVEGGVLTEGGYLRARPDAEAKLAFSDGSRVELDRASRGRVAAVGPRGARVLLDHGQARVRVVPRPRTQAGADWVFDAGPCRVQVTGTRFDMRWSPDDQQLEVRLYSGSVTVKGPPAPDGLVMQAGQRLVMDVRHDATRLSPLAPAPAAPVLPPGAATDTVEDEPSFPSPAEAPSGRPRAARRAPAATADSWSARVLAGDFDSVLREARRRGLPRVLAQDDAAQLMALGEAARLSRDNGLARSTLSALLARFPRSVQASKAMFLLGRLAEDVDGDLQRALRLYAAYLRTAPAGAYRDEAQGRQMTATLRTDGRVRARPLAEAYLRRFPDGAYAEPARAILEREP